jgi:hypothetical protein
MSEMIEGFQSLDKNLVQAFPIRVTPELMLEDKVFSGIRTEEVMRCQWRFTTEVEI